MGLAKRMGKHTEEAAFITLKDHHANFKSGKEAVCRLIKPLKGDLGKIRKMKLESINKVIRQKTKLQQWQSSREVKDWFNQLRCRKRLKFITFDINVCYPSITPELMEKAINWGSQFVKIT